jgi:hypothetical protein
MDGHRATFESPAYQDASRHRYRGGDYNIVIVEGVEPGARLIQSTVTQLFLCVVLSRA